MTAQDRPSREGIEALSRELTDRAALEIGSLADLLHSAVLMIARLERAWLEDESHKKSDAEKFIQQVNATSVDGYLRDLVNRSRWRETD